MNNLAFISDLIRSKIWSRYPNADYEVAFDVKTGKYSVLVNTMDGPVALTESEVQDIPLPKQ